MKKAILAMMLMACMTVGAQELVSENVFKDITLRADVRSTRFARPVPAGKNRKSGKPVVFYIGDSTMRNGTDGNGWNAEWGFGLFAQEWLNEDEIVVENHALGGTSSRTYYRDEWYKVKAGIEPGDFVVIDFGHNDGGKLWEIRSSINGTSATDTRVVTNSLGNEETIYSFGQYLRFFIDETRALGATPILCSRTPRGGFTDGKLTVEASYRTWGMEIANEKGVSFIDLNGIAVPMYNIFGEWKVTQFYHGGTLHTSLLGAWHNAYAHALAIAADKDNPLNKYLKDTTPAKLDIPREPGKPYTFILGGDDTSARSTFRSGKWGLVYNTLEEGDTVMLCFGNNELKSQVDNGELGCFVVTEDSLIVKQMTATSRWATIYSYGWYIHYFLNDIKEKGAIGVIVNIEGKIGTFISKKNEQLASLYGVELRKQSKPSSIANVRMNSGNLTTESTLKSRTSCC